MDAHNVQTLHNEFLVLTTPTLHVLVVGTVANVHVFCALKSFKDTFRYYKSQIISSTKYEYAWVARRAPPAM